jgi:hypothetical protein
MKKRKEVKSMAAVLDLQNLTAARGIFSWIPCFSVISIRPITEG